MPPLMNLLEDFSQNVYMICINCKVILVHNPSTNYTLRKFIDHLPLKTKYQSHR